MRLKLSGGRSQGVRPGDVVRAIAMTAGIKGSTIGSIHILPSHTFFDVPQDKVDKVLQRASECQIFEHTLSVRLAQ